MNAFAPLQWLISLLILYLAPMPHRRRGISATPAGAVYPTGISQKTNSHQIETYAPAHDDISRKWGPIHMIGR